MDIQRISPKEIAHLASQLGVYYIKELARTCYGRATQRNIRKIKHWRSGNMADLRESQKITAAAQKIIQKRNEAILQ